jgi:hypothetical protein
MEIAMLRDYEAFAALVEQIGFMPFANNKIGYPNLEALTDNEWHTGRDDDPWRWRIAIEREGRALFGKFFFGNPGFIALSRVSDFASVRRNGLTCEELYMSGSLSKESRQIYDAIADNGVLAVHEIKTLCGFDKNSSAKFESALKALQMFMLITVSGQKRKFDKHGEEYGWPSNSYATLETWLGGEVAYIDYERAKANILKTMKQCVGEIDQKAAMKFVSGIRN